ncbi:hypothetical protein COLO4_24018 [Corchorus olitorius]|uniref:ABC transporter domain-containing protein n=1 Tax=Corchorus olitorius TaxID=93759 RepID=A0A1R3IDF9_9ROSI|nr:hypothetical protein COLO4_24018 [Corchorus olitorius]
MKASKKNKLFLGFVFGFLFKASSLRIGSSSIWRNNTPEVFSKSSREEDDEEALKWAALEKLPTYLRVRRGILTEEKGQPREVDIANLGLIERRNLIERLIKIAEEDNERFLLKLKERIDRALPTLFNFSVNILEGILSYLHILPSRKKPLPILNDVSGIIKPRRMTLLLGPPSSGKTTLLLALAGKLEMLVELSRREKEANIKPDPDIDIYMKAAALEGQEASVVTDYMLKILGLEVCADTMVGDEMIRGISGGQKKRVTTGEMLVGPARALFMDEISTGLDSSTTFQIVNSLRQSIHILNGTALISLLQPAPETYDLFDDIILLSDGQIVYQGPRENVLEFFEYMGFKCPERKGVADFLQELIIVGIITMTLFLRTNMHRDTVQDGGIYMGALFFILIMIMFNGFAELAMTILKLPVFYKQRDLLFYPPWAYSLPGWILKIPVSIMEVSIWVFTSYYVIGFDPDVGRFFKHYLVLLCLSQMASGLFRLMGGLGRNIIVANTVGSFALLAVLVMGGFILTRDDVKKWWIWGYWISPLMYGQNAIAVNEFLGKSWRHIPPNSTEPLGVSVLKSRGIFPEAHWYWIGVGALIGFCFLFNFLFTLALKYLDPFGKPQAVISKETLEEKIASKTGEYVELSSRGKDRGNESSQRSASSRSLSAKVGSINEASQNRKRGMVLPFEPLSMSFDEIRYAVDMPQEMKAQGISEDRLELLKGLLLLKRGGEEIYVGPLGRHSCHLIKYFEEINGIPRIKDGYNPATWMLEVTTAAQEEALGVNFTNIYKNSELYRGNVLADFKCKFLYYDIMRLLFTTVIALLFGTIFWDLGSKRTREQDVFNSMGSLYAAVLFIGFQNSAAVQPVVAVERTVFYRERAAGMYSALPYAFGQVAIELPYIFVQTVIYGVIVYSMIGFEWDIAKFFWFIFFMYFTFLYFTFYGMMCVAVTPNHNIAAIVSSAFFAIWNLFSGFIVPRPASSGSHRRRKIDTINKELLTTFAQGSSELWRNGSMEVFSKSSRGEDDEEALKWAAIEKLPTFERIKTGIIAGEGGSLREIDVNNLGFLERRRLLERLVKTSEKDHENFLRKLKERIDRVGLDGPAIEVRFEHLDIEAEAYEGSRALPTMFNFSVNFFEGILNYLQILPSRKKPFPILEDVSGIVKPGRPSKLRQDHFTLGIGWKA